MRTFRAQPDDVRRKPPWRNNVAHPAIDEQHRNIRGVLPALELLNHRVHILPAEPTALLETDPCDIVLLDARKDLVGARSLTQLLKATGLSAPLMLILTEGGMAAVVLGVGRRRHPPGIRGPGRSRGEDPARRRARRPEKEDVPTEIRAAGVVIDEASYTARVNGAALNLTFKEFELLKYLAQHPGRVFTRQQLLTEVWGYDYYGGTRTVDVHVRRLRAKLGADHENLISTVRNVGYRLTLVRASEEEPADVTG